MADPRGVGRVWPATDDVIRDTVGLKGTGVVAVVDRDVLVTGREPFRQDLDLGAVLYLLQVGEPTDSRAIYRLERDLRMARVLLAVLGRSLLPLGDTQQGGQRATGGQSEAPTGPALKSRNVH